MCTWMEARAAELLPVPHFHVVFTLPSPIGDSAYQNKAVIYDLLFRASAETLGCSTEGYWISARPCCGCATAGGPGSENERHSGPVGSKMIVDNRLVGRRDCRFDRAQKASLNLVL